MTRDPGFPADLRAWIAEVTGRSVVAERRMPGGNRRQAWLIDVRDLDGRSRPLFLRYDIGDAASTDDPYTLHREALLGQALAGKGIPVAAVVAVHPRHQAVLTERADGDVAFYRIDDAVQQAAVARDFVSHVAALHRLDVTSFDLPGFGPLAPLPALVHRELDTWAGMYRDTGRPEPMIELGLRWLRANVPAAEGPVVLVHGDCGPANFLFQGTAVTAVLDWELAHLGDPMEDLAWLSLRAAQETFPDFPARLTEYEHHSGRPVDRDRLRYHRVFAQLRVLILRHRAHGQPNPNGDIGNGLLSAGLHRRLFVEALADVTGTVLVPPPLPEAPEAPRDWLFEAAIVQLRDIVVPGSADGLAKSRAKGIARVLKYLRNADRLGTLVAEEDRADLESLLGSPVPSTADGHGQLARRLRSGDIDDGEVLRVLGRIIARETHLLRPAMGALADRRHPPLEDS